MRRRRRPNRQKRPPKILSVDEFIRRVNLIYNKSFSDVDDAMEFLRQEYRRGEPPRSGVHIDVFANFWEWSGK